MRSLFTGLAFAALAFAQAPSQADGAAIYGDWIVEAAKANSMFKRQLHRVRKDGWLWSAITAKDEPAGAAMLIDKDGKCRVIGLGGPAATCEMKLQDKSVHFTVSRQDYTMEQEWVLGSDGKTVTQTMRQVQKGKAAPPATTHWTRRNP